MCFDRQCIDGPENMLWYVRAAYPGLGEPFYLFFCRNIADEHQPEKAFRQGFLAIGSGREFFTEFGDGITAEPDTFLGIEQRRFPNHTGNIAHAAICLFDRNIVQFFVSVFLQ